MGMSTFTGPITAGDVLNTTGSTVGSLKNVGFAELAQSVAVTQAATATALGTTIVIPANSQIATIDVYVTTAWDGSAATMSIGTSATATELCALTSVGTVGKTAFNPGTDATLTANWVDVGTSDVQIFLKSANTGDGVGYVTVRYIQALNVIP
jgi:hypothetical protein